MKGIFAKGLYPAKHQKKAVCLLNLVCYRFTDEENEAHRSAVACPESHSKSVAELGLEPSEKCLHLKD